jgi:hypothetical protein
MRNALLATAGSALALALLAHSLPASADVTVLANIEKTKDTTVTEHITITKIVDIRVGATATTTVGGTTTIIVVPINFEYKSAAEADAIVNQTSTNNTVNHSNGQITSGTNAANDFGIHLTASITRSITGNTGIVGVNQDVGNMSNQGNEVALAVATPATVTTDTPAEQARVLLNSQSEAQQINQGNDVTEHEISQSTEYRFTAINKSASITGSINGNVGIINVNQNAGNMNNQANSEALAVAINLAGVALSEAALGQVNGGPGETPSDQSNTVFESGTTKDVSMSGSLNGNVGVGGVNQAAGNMANQANIFSASFIDGGGGVGLGGAHASVE